MALHIAQDANDEHWTNFTNPLVRQAWISLLPTLTIAGIILRKAVLSSKFIAKRVQFFSVWLSIEEAETMARNDAGFVTTNKPDKHDRNATLWKTVCLCFLGLVQTMAWFGVASYTFVSSPQSAFAVEGSLECLLALTWLFATLYPARYTSPTAPQALFLLYSAQFVGALLMLGGALYDYGVLSMSIRGWVWIGNAGNLLVTSMILGVVLNMPIYVPGAGVDNSQIGIGDTPEDYCTLWEWITFRWVGPLIQKGRRVTLNEEDVWNLSTSFQSRFIFEKFSSTRSSTLLKKVWDCNARDIIVDFMLTYVGVTFTFASPFFLNEILITIAIPVQTPETRARALICTLLMFTCNIARGQADMQHLWYGRRVATRVRSVLMASIYDKSLKRKDLSGVVQDKQNKAGADTGKILNLMTTDVRKISSSLEGIFYLYRAPYALLLGMIFLYRLLGISSLVGFTIFVVTYPVTFWIFSSTVKIQKGLSIARDQRMATLTELFSAIRLIKFFAWEDKWIERAMEKREDEMKWIIKLAVVNFFSEIAWTIPPILVSVTSFLCYIALGNKLTISTAFTSVTLFTLIREPINAVPMYLMNLLQAKVAFDRIDTFLGEEEVTEQVSSLKTAAKNDQSTSQRLPTGLGLQNATLKWNEIESKQAAVASDISRTSVLASSGNSAGPAEASVDSLPATRSLAGFQLKDISVMFPEGQMTLITGPTASGKTALLMAALGELTLLSGQIIMEKNPSVIVSDQNGGLTQSISYAAQMPWLRHMSIKDNIVFENEWNEIRYNAVVECCALRPDFQMLEDGDQTEIGAKGISLSGGQKARVALARAVYARTKYVLLDDPFSAVDSHTAQFLFEHLLCGPLLKDRTVVLVTHHFDLVLPGAHYIVRMLEGRIDTQGTVEELRAQGVLENIKYEAQAEGKVKEAQVPEHANPVPPADAERLLAGDKSEFKKPRQLVKEELREEGSVKGLVYKAYLKSSTYYLWGVFFLFIILRQYTTVSEKFWIKIWGEAYNQPKTNPMILGSNICPSALECTAYGQAQVPIAVLPAFQAFSSTLGKDGPGIPWPNTNEYPFYYVGIYAAIGFTTVAFSLLSVMTQYLASICASRRLFEKLLVRTVRATMRWYDITPQGRILNRFGSDIETIDSSVGPWVNYFAAYSSALAAGVLTVIVILPWFLVPAVFIGLIYLDLSIAYANTGRDLRRLESTTKSPIFSDFAEILDGIVSVRAFAAERQFLWGIHEKIDRTTKMWYMTWMTNRWLLFRFDCLGATSVLFATLLALSGYVDVGTAGVCITSALIVTSTVYVTCRAWAQMELDFNSVERVVEYLEIPQEPSAIGFERPPVYWPSRSSIKPLIQVEDLVVKYSPELPPVLHGVSFTINSQERIGILGRTGAFSSPILGNRDILKLVRGSGKSTLAMSLLRFVEPTNGRIVIDGLNISSIGTHDLRSRLTFIPQDAVLLSGTLRENLDPFNEYDDKECLDVLRRAHLISEETSKSTSSRSSPPPQIENPSIFSAKSTLADAKQTITLSSQVSAGGSNFSQGQRQLIALARALLRRSPIIILDEATSSIDLETDAKIQATIREEFNDSLLLTVAHRLQTIIDYDRLLILDNGKVVEFDTPYNLLQKDDSIFKRMCLKSGSFSELEGIAKLRVLSA